ncbi:MAG: FliH/SctL family protein [Myxococcota bacterium]
MSEIPWRVPFRAARATTARLPKGRPDPARISPVEFPNLTEGHSQAGPTAVFEPAARDDAPASSLEEAVLAAKEQGHREGHADAERAYKAQIDDLRAHMTATLEAFRHGLTQAEARANRDALDLALLLAEHLTRSRLRTDFEAMVMALKTNASALEGSEPITIIASPESSAVLQDHIEELEKEFETGGIHIESDASFGSGDFMLRRGNTNLDLRLQQRLEQLKKVLLRASGLEVEGG